MRLQKVQSCATFHLLMTVQRQWSQLKNCDISFISNMTCVKNVIEHLCVIAANEGIYFYHKTSFYVFNFLRSLLRSISSSIYTKSYQYRYMLDIIWCKKQIFSFDSSQKSKQTFCLPSLFKLGVAFEIGGKTI